MHECKMCKAKIDFQVADELRGNIWECEECGDMICSKCIEDNGGSTSDEVERILCPTCNL